MRRKWPLAVALACASLIALSAFRPAGHPVGWLQTSEGNGSRSIEYGLFGVGMYQSNRRVEGLSVGADCRAALQATGLRNPPEIDGQFDKAERTIRSGGTQYWLRLEVKTKPKDLTAAYAKQITRSKRIPTPGSGDEVMGLAPDGKTTVRVYAATLGDGTTDVMVTFGPGSA